MPQIGLRPAVILVTLALGVLVAPGLSHAVPITGELDITGSVRFTFTAIDWQPPLGLPNGQFNVESISSGYFWGLGTPVESTGFALDLNSTDHPAGGPFPGGPLSGFLTFTLAGFTGLNFQLELIELATINPPAPGSPFNMIQIGSNTTVVLAMGGTVTDTANPASSPLGEARGLPTSQGRRSPRFLPL